MLSRFLHRIKGYWPNSMMYGMIYGHLIDTFHCGTVIPMEHCVRIVKIDEFRCVAANFQTSNESNENRHRQ